MILFIYDYKCLFCGAQNLNNHVHHYDENPDNNDAFNLVVLCELHHKIVHKGLRFENTIINKIIISDLKRLNNAFDSLSKN